MFDVNGNTINVYLRMQKVQGLNYQLHLLVVYLIGLVHGVSLIVIPSWSRAWGFYI